jgi:hypothetical protein
LLQRALDADLAVTHGFQERFQSSSVHRGGIEGGGLSAAKRPASTVR